MSFEFRKQAGLIAIALVNGLYVYPEMKRIYQRRYSVKMHDGDPTHYVSVQTSDGSIFPKVVSYS